MSNHITRTQVLLDTSNQDGEVVTFWQELAEGEDYEAGVSVALSVDKWRDLGEPAVITATVEAGDQLNVHDEQQ